MTTTTPIRAARAARAATLTLAATLATTAAAQAAPVTLDPVTIDFDSDVPDEPVLPTGVRIRDIDTGFQSDDSDIVTFRLSQGVDGKLGELGPWLEIEPCPFFDALPSLCDLTNFGLQTEFDFALDDDALILDFAQPVINLSLNFYNDEDDGGFARLNGFRDGALIATAEELFDGVEDNEQTVALDAFVIDRAEISYVFTDLEGREFSKIIDNISFEPVDVPGPAPIPVPMALPLLASAFGLVGALRATRRRPAA